MPIADLNFSSIFGLQHCNISCLSLVTIQLTWLEAAESRWRGLIISQPGTQGGLIWYPAMPIGLLLLNRKVCGARQWSSSPISTVSLYWSDVSLSPHLQMGELGTSGRTTCPTPTLTEERPQLWVFRQTFYWETLWICNSCYYAGLQWLPLFILHVQQD